MHYRNRDNMRDVGLVRYAKNMQHKHSVMRRILQLTGDDLVPKLLFLKRVGRI